MAGLLAGSDVVYDVGGDVGDDHRWAGRLVPDLTLDDGRRVATLLHRARPVLLDLSGGAAAETADGWAERVDLVSGTAARCPAAAMLVRPDGYLAWATDRFGADDRLALRAALDRWCGRVANVSLGRRARTP